MENVVTFKNWHKKIILIILQLGSMGLGEKSSQILWWEFGETEGPQEGACGSDVCFNYQLIHLWAILENINSHLFFHFTCFLGK